MIHQLGKVVPQQAFTKGSQLVLLGQRPLQRPPSLFSGRGVLCGLLLDQCLQISGHLDLLRRDRLDRADEFFFRNKLVGAAAAFQLCGVV